MMKLLLLILLVLVRYCAAIEGNIRGEDFKHEISTDHWAVELSPKANPDEVAKAHGFTNLGAVGNLENTYLFQKNERKRSVIFPHISTSPHVSWFENQVARMRFKRFKSPTDPSYPNQWHLHNSNGVDINVLSAWEKGYSGSGINIAVVDDGLQSNHPDIKYNAEGSYDFNQNDADPTPHYGDDHGTSAGGVAAAAKDNGVCGVGAGFDAALSGIRLIADYTSDAQEASGLSYRSDINDIYTNSWGPNDDGRRLEGPGTLTLRAMANAIANGRNKTGSIYVWAGGNGRSSGDNCNYDGYANSRFAITIGAVDYTGRQSYYSESCAKLLACAPSSGSSRAITTSDLLGSAGTSYSDCTSTFGGTSAAAPLVAGVVALILQANHRLTWRDVQHIFVTTSQKNDINDADWWTNGGGFHHNHKYGFGLVDASRAVDSALNYTNLPESQLASQSSTGGSTPIYDSRTIESTIVIDDDIVIETVEITVYIRHQCRGDLAITLTSPFGTKSVLQETHNDRNADIRWTYSTVRSWGEQSKGTWTLTVSDNRNGNQGSLENWQLKIYGH